MDDVIKVLIGMDEKARQAVAEKKEYRNEERAQIMADNTKLYDSYVERAQDHIKKMKEDTKNIVDQEMSTAKQDYEESLRLMEDYYNTHREEWLEAIVERCTSSGKRESR
ncbi:hypothetical protein [Anaerolentibacter hominis]|uniref:hypothetical protein n=1 Tax=Anaerolentibacter hominis TaxID=3079009 RepID=UPI0031B86791